MKYQLMIDNRPAAPVRVKWSEVEDDAIRLGVGHKVLKGLKLADWLGASVKRIKE